MLSNVIYFIGIMFSTHTHTHTLRCMGEGNHHAAPECSSSTTISLPWYLIHPASYLFSVTISPPNCFFKAFLHLFLPRCLFSNHPCAPAQNSLIPSTQLAVHLHASCSSKISGLPFFFLSTLSLAVSHTYLGCAQIEK